MNNLSDLLGFVVSTLQLSSLCEAVNIVSTHPFSTRQFALKVRAQLVNEQTLQVRLYRNGEHIDYAYQLIENQMPVMRWDNKEHFPAISTYPHHFHTASGEVKRSPLTGDPTYDLPFVLNYLQSVSP